MYSHSNCEFSENRLLNCHYHVMDTLWLGVRWSDNHSDTVHSVGIILPFCSCTNRKLCQNLTGQDVLLFTYSIYLLHFQEEIAVS